eukprot:UN18279
MQRNISTQNIFLQMFLSEILLISNGFQRIISILENRKKFDVRQNSPAKNYQYTI